MNNFDDRQKKLEGGEVEMPLIVIVGETASGKSALALEIARRFGGEIVCADSRTVYKVMDIGTAKPSPLDQSSIRHHMLDVVYPNQAFTVADFKLGAQESIADIRQRGKLPLLVGGSGLYIDSVIYDFSFRPVDIEARKYLESLSIDQLQQSIIANKLTIPENKNNKRYLIRVLESRQSTPHNKELAPNTLIFGISISKEVLQERITSRVEHMVESGLVQETIDLAERYGWDIPSMQAPAYSSMRQYINHNLSLAEAKALFVQKDLRLAKKQRTWFKRNNSIQWFSDLSKIVEITTTLLNKTSMSG